MNKIGKVYKLISLNSDKIYIGSTFLTLKERLGYHFSDYRRHHIYKTFKPEGSSSMLIQYGFDTVKIELLEQFENVDKKELRKQEMKYQLLNEKIICNKIMAMNKKKYLKLMNI